jgi:hypothetical protein
MGGLMMNTVEQAPDWFTTSSQRVEDRRFTPRTLDRSGERLAWSLAVALGALTIFLYWREGVWIASLLILFILCLAAAVLIFYGNWMERNTEFVISERGVCYRNPLRELLVDWNSVRAVSIYPRGDGWRVIVESDASTFNFQTNTTLKLGWGREVETGIIDGKALAATIAGAARLEDPLPDQDGWVRRAPMTTG